MVKLKNLAYVAQIEETHQENDFDVENVEFSLQQVR